MASAKPKVLAIAAPLHAGEEYLADFKKTFDLDIIGAKNRAETMKGIAERKAKSESYYAFMMFFGTQPYEPFDEELIKPLLPECKIFVSASAGYNEFDVDWMTKNNLWFCNTRDGVAEATADMTVFLILAALRDTTNAEKSARNDTWKYGFPLAPDPCGKVLGIIGMGAIGKYVARKAAVFNMKVQYYNRHQLPPEVEKEYNLTYCSSMEALLNSSDIVSIHCPLNPQTTGLISDQEFAQMKDGVFLINTARGPVVDEKALIAAIESGKVRRAGLDVFDNEPKINPWFMQSEKCIIQPHLGGLTEEAAKRSERECFENIKALYRTGRPVAPVNEIK